MSFFRSLLLKPWNYEGQETSAIAGDMAGLGSAPQQIALVIFLSVVTVLFSLFGVAYFMRMAVDTSSPLFCGAGYWEVLNEPKILWLNTGILIFTSGVIEWTRREAGLGRGGLVKLGLVFGAVLTLAFLYGQSVAWRELNQSGYMVNSNAATSFFYLLTGLHALHVIGGLWVWFSTTATAFFDETDPVRLSPTIKLCAIYWHFLLILWVLLFVLFLNT
ncbi:cytochrome c oxidase subunit 3 [Litorivicinus sp.]|nr:cytochrome c oxidase subunit 3 [Litorivicinus sp.]MDC1207776.1 cytochrome c oxidase subunit 3 [Litorivicinus sp.]MDC1240782.1 cytochrome c oxidase subunit 3 [Litorivicinus sp.]